MVATARRSGGWESIGGQLICRGSGFVQHVSVQFPGVRISLPLCRISAGLGRF